MALKNFDLTTDSGFLSDKGTVLVYHGQCNDGLTALGVAVYYYQRHLPAVPVTTIAGQYDNLPNIDDFKGKNVIFLDFSYSAKIIKQICDVANMVILIDHHISAFLELSEFTHERFIYVYDVERCGASLAWQCFFDKTTIPVFITYIEDRDLWTNYYPESEYQSLAIKTKNLDEHGFVAMVAVIIGEWLNGYITQTTDALVEAGKHYKNYHDALVTQIARNAFEITLDDGTPAMKCFAPMAFASDVGSYLAERYTGVALVAEQHQRSIKYSIRVAKDCDFDASIYAKSKGGGGHKKASGYREYLT